MVYLKRIKAKYIRPGEYDDTCEKCYFYTPRACLNNHDIYRSSGEKLWCEDDLNDKSYIFVKASHDEIDRYKKGVIL